MNNFYVVGSGTKGLSDPEIWAAAIADLAGVVENDGGEPPLS